MIWQQSGRVWCTFKLLSYNYVFYTQVAHTSALRAVDKHGYIYGSTIFELIVSICRLRAGLELLLSLNNRFGTAVSKFKLLSYYYVLYTQMQHTSTLRAVAKHGYMRGPLVLLKYCSTILS